MPQDTATYAIKNTHIIVTGLLGSLPVIDPHDINMSNTTPVSVYTNNSLAPIT